MLCAQPACLVVASGEAELGFRQISELEADKKHHTRGKRPHEVPTAITFLAGIVIGAKQPEAANGVTRVRASSALARSVKNSGMMSSSAANEQLGTRRHAKGF